MSDPKFTPGPWTYIPRDEDGRTPLVCDADGDPLAECWMTLKIDEQNANAALIAAAPEMYEMLGKVSEWLDRNADNMAYHNPPSAANMREAAGEIEVLLKKARGEV